MVVHYTNIAGGGGERDDPYKIGYVTIWYVMAFTLEGDARY